MRATPQVGTSSSAALGPAPAHPKRMPPALEWGGPTLFPGEYILQLEKAVNPMMPNQLEAC